MPDKDIKTIKVPAKHTRRKLTPVSLQKAVLDVVDKAPELDTGSKIENLLDYLDSVILSEAKSR